MNILKLLKAELVFIKVFVLIALSGSLLTHSLVVFEVSNLARVELRKFVETGLGHSAFDYGDSQVEHVLPISDYLSKSNELMSNFISDNAFYIIKDVHVRLEMIDLVQNPNAIQKKNGFQFTLGNSFFINKHDAPRKVIFSMTTTPNVGMHAIIWIILFIVLRYVWLITPTPFSKYQNRWRQVILDSDRTGSNLDDSDIDTVISQFPLNDPFGDNRLRLFSILNNEHKITIKEAISELKQPQLNEFNEAGWHWLFVALKHKKNLDESILIASMDDKVNIDVRHNTLQFRGLPIKLSGTPLAFYGWYLLHRLNSQDGWIATPDANMNYPELKNELESLFDEWDVHSRGSMFTEDGVSLANRLKNNRNRIKTAIEEELDGYADIAAPYLFETGQMTFRVMLKPENITII